MVKIETITFNKRDSDNYEITIHKGYDNLSIIKDKEYLEGLIKYIQDVIDDKFEWEYTLSREEYFKI